MEGSVRSGNRGLQNLNFLGSDSLGNCGFSFGLLGVFSGTLGGSSSSGDFFGRFLGCRIVIKLDVERLLSGVSSSSWDNISLGDVTGGLVRSTSSGVLVVMRNRDNLLLLASGRSRAVHRTIGTRALLSLAVDKDGSVVTSARWEVGERSGNLKRVPLSHGLGKVERFALHLDVFTEILITVHASSEKFVIGNITGDSLNTRGHAGINFNESTSRRHSLVPGGRVKVRRSVNNSGSRGVSKK
jgi:hypothetical protein